MIVRQVRHTLSSTVLVTFEQDVLPAGSPISSGRAREGRSGYRYPNGSEIVLAGLDDPGKAMSGEYDIIYIAEATQVTEDALEFLDTRLRNGRLGWHQLIMDCNPDSAQHWLNKRCIAGRTRRLISRLEDNPRYFLNGSWTNAGNDYLKRLESLTGHRRRRLLEGVWASAEGARFPDAARQVQGRDLKAQFSQGFPRWWKRWISCDYGISDPYCALWHVRDEEGHIYTYQCDYQTGYEADQQAERIRSLSGLEDVFEGVWIDRSMFRTGRYAAGFGATERGSAAEQYSKVLSRSQFGEIKQGAPNIQEEGYVTLYSLLRSGQWIIDVGCAALWDEIEGAVFFRDSRTGIQYDLVNPHARKNCPDHALEAAVYGVHKRSPETRFDEPADLGASGKRILNERQSDLLTMAQEFGYKLPDWAR